MKIRKTNKEEEIIVKIGSERIDIQEKVIVEALLDNGTTELIMSSEFVKKAEI